MEMKEGMRMRMAMMVILIMVIMTVNLRNPNIFNSSEMLNVKNEGSLKQR